MEKNENLIDGKDIIGVVTRKSWYDNDCVIAYLKKEKNENDESRELNGCLIKTETLFKMMKYFVFETKPKRKYDHLEINWTETKKKKDIVALAEIFSEIKDLAKKAYKIGSEYGWARGNIFMGNFSTIGYLLERIIKT